MVAQARSAWKPGNSEPRPVGRGMIRSPRVFHRGDRANVLPLRARGVPETTRTNHTVPYGTGL